jgi:hypothetical protein
MLFFQKKVRKQKKVPRTALQGPFKYLWRIEDRKRFEYQSNGLYMNEDSETISLYMIQKIRWEEQGGYILSNNPVYPLERRYPPEPLPSFPKGMRLLTLLEILAAKRNKD